MWIEAVRDPFTYRWPGGEVRLIPGKPVDLPYDRAKKLMERHPELVCLVFYEVARDPVASDPYVEGTRLRFDGGLGHEEVGVVDGHTVWDLYPGEICYRIGERTIPHSRILGIAPHVRIHTCRDCQSPDEAPEHVKNDTDDGPEQKEMQW